MLRFITPVLLAFLAAACTPSDYDSTIYGGVDARRIADNRFEIDGGANGFTQRGYAEEFALLKAAETTLENGQETFRVLETSYVRTRSHRGAEDGATYLTLVIETASAQTAAASGEHYYSAPEIMRTLGPKHLD